MRKTAVILAVLVASIAVITASDRRALNQLTKSLTNPTATDNTGSTTAPTTTTTTPAATSTPTPTSRRGGSTTPAGTTGGGTTKNPAGTTGGTTPTTPTTRTPTDGTTTGNAATDNTANKGKSNPCDDRSYCCGNPGQCHGHPNYCTWCIDNCCRDACNPSCWNYDKCNKKGCGNVCSACPTQSACENGRPKNCCWQSNGPGELATTAVAARFSPTRVLAASTAASLTTSATSAATTTTARPSTTNSCTGGQHCCFSDHQCHECCYDNDCPAKHKCKDNQCVCSTDKGADCDDQHHCPNNGACDANTCACPPVDSRAANDYAGYTDCRLNYPASKGGHGCKPNPGGNPKGYECPACNAQGSSCGPGYDCDESHGTPTCVHH
ncbi:hypothetical protein C2E21_1885 isoform A [Chlorella sorokiniana]|uniref:Uncharacterized protein n=1 Tax=Chlorella sorokiniana TaxID=3076 RepID=A0A2P6TZL4_CHLSO|nr:hypothetical protein C2E21_1885 isoform A [Chlorella sorokiniana]|eukprot:PRW59505.1 hypothetical protein C2E21_1885 isoform A [Chlorella sorokiniana]